ncbi:MAG: hypothetical protein IJH34_02140 [Romboutsia sp.]|nr:hypothetical protein [Romboutsia sp.]
MIFLDKFKKKYKRFIKLFKIELTLKINRIIILFLPKEKRVEDFFFEIIRKDNKDINYLRKNEQTLNI